MTGTETNPSGGPIGRREFLRWLAGSPVFAYLAGCELPDVAGQITGVATGPALDDLVGSAAEALDVFDLEKVARNTLPPAHWGYIQTGVDGEATYRIAPDKVRSNFPDDTGFNEVMGALRDGLIEGLSPEREIALKSLLGEPAGSWVESMQVLLVSSDDDGDRISRIDSIAVFIEDRLGARAFQVKKGTAKKLAEALRKLGIAVEVG